MTTKRPFFVSVIAGVLLVFSAYLLFEIITALSNRSLAIGPLGVAAIYYISMALGLLMGKNWARILFIWFMSTSLLFQFKGEIHGLLVANIIYYLGSAYFLTRPAAINFFLPNEEAARWNKTAYRMVALLIVINFAGTFFRSPILEGAEKFGQWATKTFHIGYINHDIASLKLPSDWIEDSATRSVLNGWSAMTGQGDFEAMAWGGLSALGVSEIDFETGRITKRDDSSSFNFDLGYLREDGTLMPCGLARYQVTFPEDTKDPLFQILKSQANHGSDKHQYYWSPDFRVLEYDRTKGNKRFIVWNWQRNDDPNHIYGMIIGLPSKDPHQQNSCHIADVINSLELNGSDGTTWHATELDAQYNPTMTPVSGVSIDLDLATLWRYGIDGNTFFPILNAHLDQSTTLTVDSLSEYRVTPKDDADLRLIDIAEIYQTGKGRQSQADPWYMKIVNLHIGRCGSVNGLEEYERRYLKAVVDSKIPFKLNCGR